MTAENPLKEIGINFPLNPFFIINVIMQKVPTSIIIKKNQPNTMQRGRRKGGVRRKGGKSRKGGGKKKRRKGEEGEKEKRRGKKKRKGKEKRRGKLEII